MPHSTGLLHFVPRALVSPASYTEAKEKGRQRRGDSPAPSRRVHCVLREGKDEPR